MAGKIKKVVKQGFISGLNPVKGILGALVGDEISKTVGPILQDAVKDYSDHQKQLVKVPNVIDAKISDAKEYLINKGFFVTEKLAVPHSSLQHKTDGDIVKVVPKVGTKVEPGEMIVLYYVDEAVIKASQDIDIELVDVEGMSIDKAKAHLNERGLQVEICPLNPHRKYHLQQADTVIKMKPKPTFLNQAVKGDTIVKLFTLDAEAIAKSKELAKPKAKEPKKSVLDIFKRDKK